MPLTKNIGIIVLYPSNKILYLQHQNFYDNVEMLASIQNEMKLQRFVSDIKLYVYEMSYKFIMIGTKIRYFIKSINWSFLKILRKIQIIV